MSIYLNPGKGAFKIALNSEVDVDELIHLLSWAVLQDLRLAYPKVDYLMPDRLMFSLKDVYEETGRQKALCRQYDMDLYVNATKHGTAF